jgi:hypothetical protein
MNSGSTVDIPFDIVGLLEGYVMARLRSSFTHLLLAANYLAVCLTVPASARETMLYVSAASSQKSIQACFPAGKSNVQCQSRKLILAGQCEDNCRIVFNHCRAIGRDSDDCRDEYRVCMNAC